MKLFGLKKKNKYVDFVSDEHFLSCVKYVCDGYVVKQKSVDMKRLTRNSLDVFKLIFDIHKVTKGIDKWIKAEVTRQDDKTISNRIGEFHQKLLGGVNGWIDLGKGHPLGIDLMDKDEENFIELKNKHNTVKKKDLPVVFDNLKKVTEKYPKGIAYYAYIIPEKRNNVKKVWKIPHRKPNERIIEICGFKLYELITGDGKNLIKVWEAIPKAINDLSIEKINYSENDKVKLRELFNLTFNTQIQKEP